MVEAMVEHYLQVGKSVPFLLLTGGASTLRVEHVKKTKPECLEETGAQDPRHYVVETQQQGYQLSGFVFAPEVRAKVASRWDAFTSES